MKTHSNDYKNNLIGVREFKPRLILNNKFNTTTKTGKNITITDNVTNNFENIQILGDTYQASTPTPSSPVPIQNVTGLQNVTICGKNLFNKNDTVVGYLRNTNGTINSESGTHTSNYIIVKPNESYIRTTSEGNAYYDSNKNFISYYYGKNITTPNNAKYIRITVNDNNLDNEQLEYGSASTTYEAYQGQSYDINLGRNLLDTSNYTIIGNELSIVRNDDGSFTINGTNTQNHTISFYNDITLDGDYTLISIGNKTPTNTSYITLYKTNNLTDVITYFNMGNNNHYSNFNSTQKSLSQKILLGASTYTDFIIKPMLVKGTYNLRNIGNYISYVPPIELNKIDDYQDYISGTPNNWVINKLTRRISLNVSDMDNEEDYPGWRNVPYIKNDYPNENSILYNLTNYILNIHVYGGDYCSINTNSTNSTLYLPKQGYNLTQTEWKTNYPNLIVNLIYGLQTPTTETITNTELINQLNALYNATSYDGQTNIIVSGDLAGYLKVEYINELDAINEDDIKLIKPILNTDLFRTSMKCLELELTFKLDKNVLIHFENGLKVNDNYEYLDYGDYYVYEVEYQADTKTYVHTCYDKMLNTMISYKPLNVTYPITVRNYITAIANACGLEFADSTNLFVNYNINITKDYFSQGSFTYRDVLDYLCEVIGGWLYIDDNNKLSIKYPTETNEVLNGDYLNAINVDFNKKYGPVNSIVFARANELDNIEYKDDSSISLNGLCRVKFSDNPFLSGEDRQNFMSQELKDKIMGMEFYLCDYESKGITYLELGDYYTIKTSDDVIEALKSGLVKSGLRKAQNKKQYEYKCLMLNDEQIFKKGLTEKIYTEEQPMGENITTAPTDNSIKNAEILVNKNAGEIILKANSDGKVVQARLDADADDGTLFEVKADNIKLEGYTTINNGFSVDINGNMAANNGTFSGSITTESGEIGGFNISSTKLSKSVSGLYDYNYFDYNIVPPIVTGKVNIVSSIENIYDANDSGSITAADYAVIKNIVNGLTTNTKNVSGSFEINSNNPKKCLQIKNNNNDTIVSAGVGGIETALLNANTIVVGVDKGSYASDQITLNGTTGNVTCVSLTQTSLEESKKNFTKLENGLDIIKNIDIYKYNYQNEDDKDKEHIGFVIGENYKYSKEVTSLNNDGVDIYSFVSVCCKAIQEQQEQIEELKEEIKSLKESDK